METRLLKTTGYLFCLLGLFFFIKNFPILWYLNNVSLSQELNLLAGKDETLFWFKFSLTFLGSVFFPLMVGLYLIDIAKSSEINYLKEN
jgi:hypothetical protein